MDALQKYAKEESVDNHYMNEVIGKWAAVYQTVCY